MYAFNDDNPLNRQGQTSAPTSDPVGLTLLRDTSMRLSYS